MKSDRRNKNLETVEVAGIVVNKADYKAGFVLNSELGQTIAEATKKANDGKAEAAAAKKAEAAEKRKAKAAEKKAAEAAKKEAGDK